MNKMYMQNEKYFTFKTNLKHLKNQSKSNFTFDVIQK